MFCSSRPFSTAGRGSWLPYEPNFLCGVAPVSEVKVRTSTFSHHGPRAGFRPLTGREPFTPQYLSSGFPFRGRPGNASAPTEPTQALHYSGNGLVAQTGDYTDRYVLCQADSPRAVKVRLGARPKPRKLAAAGRGFGRRKRRPLSPRSPLRLWLPRRGAGDYSPSPPPASSPSPAATTAFCVTGSGTAMMSGRSSKLCSIAA